MMYYITPTILPTGLLQLCRGLVADMLRSGRRLATYWSLGGHWVVTGWSLAGHLLVTGWSLAGH